MRNLSKTKIITKLIPKETIKIQHKPNPVNNTKDRRTGRNIRRVQPVTKEMKQAPVSNTRRVRRATMQKVVV